MYRDKTCQLAKQQIPYEYSVTCVDNYSSRAEGTFNVGEQDYGSTASSVLLTGHLISF